MITSKKTAIEVTAAGERFVEALNKCLIEVQSSSTPEEFEQFRRVVGLTIGRLDTELLEPIYRAHPELEPHGLR
jgi:hypothetical protein